MQQFYNSPTEPTPPRQRGSLSLTLSLSDNSPAGIVFTFIRLVEGTAPTDSMFSVTENN